MRVREEAPRLRPVGRPTTGSSGQGTGIRTSVNGTDCARRPSPALIHHYPMQHTRAPRHAGDARGGASRTPARRAGHRTEDSNPEIQKKTAAGCSEAPRNVGPPCPMRIHTLPPLKRSIMSDAARGRHVTTSAARRERAVRAQGGCEHQRLAKPCVSTADREASREA